MSNTERLHTALEGRYKVERQLGQGGMATVYLAQDLKHDRKVALKVLKPELSAVLGADRFVVEIKTTASLQHPHILPLFDSGVADGLLFYVMPYVEGETLRGRLNRETQLSVEDAVRIAREVADALDYAHRHGVVHRDIKPENILLHDGRPMVADFGIALAVSAAAGGRMTETGLSLGTPHYMSPEQATAEKDITARSDIYSIASVLYEMLGGQPPHMGGSAQQIIMRIITDTARPVTELRRSVPPHIAAALAKALEKLPADRFSTAKAFADALGSPEFTYTGQTRSQAYTSHTTRPAPRPALLAVGAAMVLVAGLAAGLLVGGRGREEPRVVRFPFTLPPAQQLLSITTDDAPFALSPDGRTIVAVVTDSASGSARLYLRSMDQMVGTTLAGTDGATAPFFSPDGKWIGFHTRPGLGVKKVALTGGGTTPLSDEGGARLGASWGDDGTIVFTNRRLRLSRVRGTGGSVEEVVRGDSTSLFLWPAMLPGSKHVLAMRCDNGCLHRDLVAVELASGRVAVVVPNAARGWYAPGGHLVYHAAEGAIYSAAFDAKSIKVTGDPIPLIEGVQQARMYGAQLSIAATNGTMLYLPGAGTGGTMRIVSVDRSGRERTLIERQGGYDNPRWSPDRRRIALSQQGSGGGAQIWVFDMASQTFTQLTREGDNVRPTWSPDGTMLAFTRNGNGLMWMPADGSKPAEKVMRGVANEIVTGLAANWTRDGKWITVDGPLLGSKTGEDVFAVSVAKRGMEPVVTTPGNDQTGAVSPDGQWIAYASDESEGNKVYVRPFRAPGGRFLISTGPATQALWLSNHELTYMDGPSMSLMVADMQLGGTVQVTARTRLFDIRPYSRGCVSGCWDYDVSRDGREFLMVRPDRQANSTEPLVVLNWAEEIKRRTKEQGGR